MRLLYRTTSPFLNRGATGWSPASPSAFASFWSFFLVPSSPRSFASVGTAADGAGGGGCFFSSPPSSWPGRVVVAVAVVVVVVVGAVLASCECWLAMMCSELSTRSSPSCWKPFFACRHWTAYCLCCPSSAALVLSSRYQAPKYRLSPAARTPLGPWSPSGGRCGGSPSRSCRGCCSGVRGGREPTDASSEGPTIVDRLKSVSPLDEILASESFACEAKTLASVDSSDLTNDGYGWPRRRRQAAMSVGGGDNDGGDDGDSGPAGADVPLPSPGCFCSSEDGDGFPFFFFFSSFFSSAPWRRRSAPHSSGPSRTSASFSRTSAAMSRAAIARRSIVLPSPPVARAANRALSSSEDSSADTGEDDGDGDDPLGGNTAESVASKGRASRGASLSASPSRPRRSIALVAARTRRRTRLCGEEEDEEELEADGPKSARAPEIPSKAEEMRASAGWDDAACSTAEPM
mmetsp:Transcript_25387/g.61141  ORF Transcript_25387/g.61141 Transcript_25387/m.61141 type:complete len:461 (-) Transcript_25387:215-1597(-)